MSNGLINRQYVGARYVPKIMGEWNKPLQYEALSVVTYMGNSFTSKVPVPANVEISNTDYWVNTGNYNAQVENYRQETLKIKNELNNEIINRKNADNELRNILGKTILIGDSYAGEETKIGSSWAKIFNNITKRDNIISAKGGAGFTVVGYKTFLTLLQEVKDNNNDAKTIIVLGGYNEQIHGDVNNIKNSIKEFMNYVHANMPYATVYIGMIGGSMKSNVQLYETYKYYKAGACENGAVYLEGSQNIIKGNLNIQGDLIHPTLIGNTRIASALLSMIFGNYQPTIDGLETITYNEGFSGNISTFQINSLNGITKINYGTDLRIGFPNLNITASPTAPYIEIGTFTCYNFYSSYAPYNPSIQVPAILQFTNDDTNTFYYGNVIMYYHEGKIKVRPIAWADSQFVTGNLTAIRTYGYGQITVPLSSLM